MFGMAALLPIISELLPMIMPSSISVTKASDVFPPEFLPSSSGSDAEQQPNGSGNGNGHINGSGSSSEKKHRPRTRNGNKSGSGSGIKVISRDAIVNKTDKMCATVLIIPPQSSTTIRHNGEQDAIIYAASGSTGILLSAPPEEALIELPKPKPKSTSETTPKYKPSSQPKPKSTSETTPKYKPSSQSKTNGSLGTPAQETDELPPIRLMDLEAEAEEQPAPEEVKGHKRDKAKVPVPDPEPTPTPTPEPEPVPHPLAQGDFAFIPAWTEHQARNDSPTEPVIWVVIRSGGSPVEVNLTDWGGETAEENENEKDKGASSLLRQLIR